MLFLLLRLLPYIIPILFLASAKAVFIFSDNWVWCLAAIIALPLAYFAFLKQQNRAKPVLWLMIFAAVFAVSGFAYSLILESAVAINIFLIVWSLVYWFYLEAVFHDFYKTAKSNIFNLLNISLYGGLLIVFFLTATLVSFNIFLNLSWLWLLPAAAVYFSISQLVFLRSSLKPRPAALYASVIDLILIEILGGLLLWPSSFYVIAIIVALCYYFLTQIMIYVSADKLNRGRLVRLLLFFSSILLIVLVTAAWL
ncbi:MAG: hypothetical protein WC517_02210 [Patescibacteria group bacterium]